MVETQEQTPEVLKVGSDSSPNQVAAAIAGAIRREGSNREVKVRAIGAGAVNQAVKAIAIARGFVAPNGLNLSCIPGFEEVEIEGEERTAIGFTVKAD